MDIFSVLFFFFFFFLLKQETLRCKSKKQHIVYNSKKSPAGRGSRARRARGRGGLGLRPGQGQERTRTRGGHRAGRRVSVCLLWFHARSGASIYVQGSLFGTVLSVKKKKKRNKPKKIKVKESNSAHGGAETGSGVKKSFPSPPCSPGNSDLKE